MTPDLFSLLRSTRVNRSIEIDSLILNQKAIDKMPKWAEGLFGWTEEKKLKK